MILCLPRIYQKIYDWPNKVQTNAKQAKFQSINPNFLIPNLWC